MRHCESLDYDNVSTHLSKGTAVEKIAKAKSNRLDNYLDVRKWVKSIWWLDSCEDGNAIYRVWRYRKRYKHKED